MHEYKFWSQINSLYSCVTHHPRKESRFNVVQFQICSIPPISILPKPSSPAFAGKKAERSNVESSDLVRACAPLSRLESRRLGGLMIDVEARVSVHGGSDRTGAGMEGTEVWTRWGFESLEIAALMPDVGGVGDWDVLSVVSVSWFPLTRFRDTGMESISHRRDAGIACIRLERNL